jgi:hypothetical protein
MVGIMFKPFSSLGILDWMAYILPPYRIWHYLYFEKKEVLVVLMILQVLMIDCNFVQYVQVLTNAMEFWHELENFGQTFK